MSKHFGRELKVASSTSTEERTLSREWARARAFSPASIRWKILAIALIAAIAFAAYLGFNQIQFNSQAALLEDIRNTRYPLQAKLQEGLFALRLLQAEMQDAVLTGEIESLEEASLLRDQFFASIMAVRRLDPSKTPIVEEVEAAFLAYYDASFGLARDLIEGNRDFASSARRGEQNAVLYSEVTRKLELFKAHELKTFTDAVNRVTEQANSIIRIGFRVGLVTVLLLFTLALVTSRWIIARINHIVKTLRTIAREDGDMSVRIPVEGNDEMAELSYWFNRFIARLERITTESTREIRRLAYTDSLTNLPNRRLFNRHLQAEISRCGRLSKSLAVMFLDLDNFKLVNDQLGHEAGDALVCEVARRLEQTVRGSDLVALDLEGGLAAGEDLVARMGGDEFMLVISDLNGTSGAAAIAERVRKTILRPIDLHGTGIEIGVSIGIAVYPDNGATADELIVKADLAMYEAKNRDKNNYCFYNTELEEAARLDAEIETALRQALHNGELELYFQPKYDIGTGTIVGAEALLRWQHPEFGWISPARFVPLAEHSDLIYELDQWVIQESCRQIRLWREAGTPVTPIAINIPAKLAAHGSLVGIVRAAVKANSLPPYSVELEITETSALKNIESVAENIRQVRESSVTVALDDFGAGHSSLSLLKFCQIDSLKIDRGFISELNQEGTRTTIISGVIAMAQVLELSVVAEGVEEEAQLRELKKNGLQPGPGLSICASDAGRQVSRIHATTKQNAPSDQCQLSKRKIRRPMGCESRHYCTVWPSPAACKRKSNSNGMVSVASAPDCSTIIRLMEPIKIRTIFSTKISSSTSIPVSASRARSLLTTHSAPPCKLSPTAPKKRMPNSSGLT